MKTITGSTLANLATAVTSLTFEQYLSSHITFEASDGDARLFILFPQRKDVRWYTSGLMGFSSIYIARYIYFYNGDLKEVTKNNDLTSGSTNLTVSGWTLYYRN
jgi:hypothetical protein